MLLTDRIRFFAACNPELSRQAAIGWYLGIRDRAAQRDARLARICHLPPLHAQLARPIERQLPADWSDKRAVRRFELAAAYRQAIALHGPLTQTI